MYVIPSEFYESLMRRTKLTENPLLTEEVKIEEEKEKVLRKRRNPDVKVAELVALKQKQQIIREKRKKNEPENQEKEITPISISTIPLTPAKKPGRPSKKLKNVVEYQLGKGEKKNLFLENFYSYEPKGKTMMFLKSKLT